MNELTVKDNSIVNAELILRDNIRRFLLSLDIKQSSRLAYEKGLKHFLAWILQERLASPTREDLLRYKNTLTAKGLASSTLSLYR